MLSILFVGKGMAPTKPGKKSMMFSAYLGHKQTEFGPRMLQRPQYGNGNCVQSCSPTMLLWIIFGIGIIFLLTGDRVMSYC
jgi:hypothetical protein